MQQFKMIFYLIRCEQNATLFQSKYLISIDFHAIVNL